MNGEYLLDTNIVIALFANEAVVIDHLRGAEEVFIPSIVMGELYYGARKSSRTKENVARIDEFVSNNVILNCDIETARSYGQVKDKLRAKGRPIPENDVWIAALALQHGLTLISRDSHFRDVDELTFEVW
jgi:tRNA(fMet)-specific endonuclease VapC